jgi:transporter family protein
MTSATAYAAGAMVLFGLGDFIFKCSASAGVPARHFLLVQAWVFAALILVYALATDTLHLEPQALWGSAGGLFIFVGFYHFARSLAFGSVSVNAPVFRLNFLVTSALAIWVLGEPLTGRKVLALGMAVAATGLLLDAGSGAGGSAPRRALLHVAVATAAFGVGNFLHKMGASRGVTPATMGVAQSAVYVTLATLVVLAADRSVRPAAATWRYAPTASVVLAAAFICLLSSLARGEASMVVPITQMGFVVSGGLGIAVLGEPLTARKLAGIAIALGSLAVLASA